MSGEIGAGLEAGAALLDGLLCATEKLAAGFLSFSGHGGDLGVGVVEDFAEQEDCAFERAEVFEQDEEGHLEGFR